MHAGIDRGDTVRLSDAAVVIAERLAKHGEVHVAAAHAAVLGWVHEPHVATVGEGLAGLEGILARLVQLADLGLRQHTIQHAENAGAHLPLLLAETECHVRIAHAIRSLISGLTSAAKRSNYLPRRS